MTRRGACVAFGSFEFVHKGHLNVAEKVVELARVHSYRSIIISCPSEGEVYTTEKEKEYLLRNVGLEAVRRNCIRGQIRKGGEYINETANFYGPHFIECYIVKKDICVARDKISVDIDYN